MTLTDVAAGTARSTWGTTGLPRAYGGWGQPEARFALVQPRTH